MDELPAPSSLMSSRWSRDNLVTCHPAQLYGGKVVEPIDEDALEALIRDLERRTGPVHVGAGRMGVLTWDITCAREDGAFTLQVPLALDEPGARGRAKRDVPWLNVENMRHFIAQGLTRFVVQPQELMTLGGDVPAATFGLLPDHHPLSFGRGSLHVELAEGERSWLIPLGPRATAEVLAEMVAALAYHYEPDTAGGTALCDVFINDGDFVVKRRRDGTFDVRLTAARRREPGIGPGLLLLYLIQMMAYEDFAVDGKLTGLPTLAGNPSVAFEGLVRGRSHRHLDLGGSEEAGRREALDWIRAFGRAREGRAYRGFVDRFLAGGLPLAFGEDPRERWWRLVPLRTKLGVLELRARRDPASPDAASARALRAFVDRLSREIGRGPEDDPGTARVNDLGRDGLLDLLATAGLPAAARAGAADDLLARWPYRSLDHLAARVPGARGLRRLKSRVGFGRVIPDAEQGTLTGFGPAPADDAPARPLANPELFGGPILPVHLHAAAVRTFPTFEAYMDGALHDPTWGYYARRVSIGRGGHFITNPESLSPSYGGWIATAAFRCWRELIGRGELAETDPFPIIEFGAGNGRLARDVLDAVARRTDEDGRAFAARVAYRIYETSPSLRDRQRTLLGRDAAVAAGDARRPGETLARDFPDGVKGLVLTNEVPDAFGVHKLFLTPDGDARAVLVVPRAGPALGDAVGAPLGQRIADTDRRIRQAFALDPNVQNAGDHYLDAETYAAVMTALAGHDEAARDALLAALWFEETTVPAAEIPALAAHLAANAAEYATALAAEGAGVVLYVNVHADRFIRELGSSLASGFIVTIDYGDTTWGLVQGARRCEFPFRVYGDQQDFVPRPNDPYALPGTQDLTADVDFTALAQAGRGSGLEVVHFGPERDVTGADLPALALAAAGDEALGEFLGNPVFKLLVLGKRASDAFTGPLAPSLPLWARVEDVPRSRRARIAPVRDRLTLLSNSASDPPSMS